MGSRLLSISDLTVKFGGLTALSDVHIEVNPGEVVGLIGPNGAGKTTLFNALTGFAPVSSGKLLLNEKEHEWPKSHELAELGIARTLQGVGLFPDLTVEENVMLGAHSLAKAGLIESFLGLTGKDERRLKERAQTALERAYSGSLTERRADTLAYPDTKRVSIARALVSEPRILLLDEPTANLDPSATEQVENMIREFNQHQCDVIFSSHQLAQVQRLAQYIIFIDQGEIKEMGPAGPFFSNPQTLAAKRYLHQELNVE